MFLLTIEFRTGTRQQAAIIRSKFKTLIFFSFSGRMLQLILGCAVNCDHKQQYIESIMNLEESVQQVLMLAIQEMIKSGSGQRAFYNMIRGVTTVNVMSFLYVGESRRNRPFVFVLIFSRLSSALHYLSQLSQGAAL